MQQIKSGQISSFNPILVRVLASSLLLLVTACHNSTGTAKTTAVSASPAPAARPEFTLLVFRDYCKSLAQGGDAQAIKAIVETHGVDIKAKVKYIDSDLYGGIISLEVVGPPEKLAENFASAGRESPNCGEQCGERVARKGTMGYWVWRYGDFEPGQMGLICRAFDPERG